MKTFVNTISDFCCKHRTFSVTIILFIIVNSCFHSGSKVNQDNLSKLFGVEFPPCRAAKEIGQFNNGGEEWQFTGKLIFKTMPTEEFYLSLICIFLFSFQLQPLKSIREELTFYRLMEMF